MTQVSNLSGPALDWAVWNIEHGTAKTDDEMVSALVPFTPSTDWAQGGPIIEREYIILRPADDGWQATIETATQYGPTPLIAAMRCFVASKLGESINLPEELQ